MRTRPHVLRPRAWIGGALLALMLLAAIVALIRHDGSEPARPALWRISSGTHHGWLFGTIHAVPPGVRWLTPRIAEAMAQSDALILEATGLAEERNDPRIFERLGRSPGLPPVSTRLAPADRARLTTLAPDLPADLDNYEDWAAALLIGAAGNARVQASADGAGEAVLEAAFRKAGKPVAGLETITAQLGAFDALLAADQRILLAQSVREAADAPRLYADLYAHWAAGDLAALEQQFLAPLAATPGLRAALIDRRNAVWADAIDRRLRSESTVPFVAVGAGHLVGPGSLAARLAAKGWTVKRVQ